MTKLFHTSIREAADWNDLPLTAHPVSLQTAKERARFYDCKLWLQTRAGDYLGTVTSTGRVIWNDGDEIEVIWKRIGMHCLLEPVALKETK